MVPTSNPIAGEVFDFSTQEAEASQISEFKTSLIYKSE